MAPGIADGAAGVGRRPPGVGDKGRPATVDWAGGFAALTQGKWGENGGGHGEAWTNSTELDNLQQGWARQVAKEKTARKAEREAGQKARQKARRTTWQNGRKG